jgi:hypothetical protein
MGEQEAGEFAYELDAMLSDAAELEVNTIDERRAEILKRMMGGTVSAPQAAAFRRSVYDHRSRQALPRAQPASGRSRHQHQSFGIRVVCRRGMVPTGHGDERDLIERLTDARRTRHSGI